MVEIIVVIVETANQRFERAAVWVNRHECRFRSRNLHKAPGSITAFLHADYCPSADPVLRIGLVAQAARSKTQAIATDADRFAALDMRLYLLGIGREYQCRQQIACVTVFLQLVFVGVFVTLAS